ncbi:tail fiber assembly protein [Enterobacter asburiae]|nr:tail fiber assembly protein [Enterobacter asburiae]
MITSSVFSITNELSESQKELADKFDVKFINDKNGVDWYEYQKKFQSDTWKVCVDTNGRVCSFSKDISSVFPMDLMVVEIDNIPDGLNIIEPWYMDLKDKSFYRDETLVAELKRQSLINDVTSEMLPLIQASEDGDITNEEEDELMSLRKYRTELRRLDISNAPDIQWPKK